MPRYVQQIRSYPREIKLYLLYTLFANLGLGVFTLLFNLYLVHIGLHEDFIGLFNAVTTVAIGVVALVMGMLINRLGSWACITYGTAFFLLTSVLVTLSGNPAVLISLAILNGAGTAFLTVPTMPYLMEWASIESRSTVAALAFSLNSLSLMLGSLVGGWTPRVLSLVAGLPVGTTANYRSTLLFGIALAMLGLIPMWSLRGLRRGERPRVRPLARQAAPRIPRQARRQVRQDTALFVAVGLLMSLGAGAVIPFYNVYLSNLGARPAQIGTIFSVANAIAALLGLLAPLLAGKLGSLPAVFLVRLAPAPAYLLLALNPRVGIAVAVQILRNTSGNMGWPIDSTFIAEVLPAEARANAYSLRSAAWNLGYAAASFVGGVVIVRVGYAPTFVCYALTMALSVSLFVGYFWSRRSPANREARSAARAEEIEVAAT